MVDKLTLEGTRYGAGNRNIDDGSFSAYHRDQVVNAGVPTVAAFRLIDWEFQKCVLIREMGAIYTLDVASTEVDNGDTFIHDLMGRVYAKGAFDGASIPGPKGDPGGAFSYAFDGGSQAMADPGPGLFRLNDATPESATAMAVAADLAGGSDVSGLIMARLGSTSLIKARLVITSDANRLEFDVSGAADNGAWIELALADGVIVGTLSDEADCAVVLDPSGDRGSDGVQSSDASVTDIVAVTLAEYEALDPPDATTFYIVVSG